jgi:3-methyladenine DNA glycosylase Mpg
MWLESGEPVANKLVAKTARIGLGTESVWKEKPLRFVVRGNEHVSVAFKGAGS